LVGGIRAPFDDEGIDANSRRPVVKARGSRAVVLALALARKLFARTGRARQRRFLDVFAGPYRVFVLAARIGRIAGVYRCSAICRTS
jgi:hypothetical protein